jgi:hypothetical protein
LHLADVSVELGFAVVEMARAVLCESVQKQNAIIPYILGYPTSASRYFSMLPDPVELSSVRSESTGAFLGASEITCSY